MLLVVEQFLNGLQFGFGHAADRIAMVLAGHGPSAAYGYSDYIWQKYRIGEFFKRPTLMFNGYGDQVASLYTGMDLKKNF